MSSLIAPPPPPLGPEEVFRLMVLHTTGLEHARRNGLETECRQREGRLALWRLLLDLDAAVGVLRDWRCLTPPITEEEAKLLRRRI